LVSKEQKEKIIESIELKFENILNNSLKVIDEKIKGYISIDLKDESDDDIRQPKNNMRYTSLGMINMFSMDPYSKDIISDIGEYRINILVNHADMELRGITNYVKEIIFYIIDQCEVYLKIDIHGLFRYLENEKQVKKSLGNILSGDYRDYIEYCQLEDNNERFYSEINKIYINYFNKIMTNGNKYSNITQHLNIISSTPYESKYNKAKLVIFKKSEDLKSYIIENKAHVIEFEKHIKISNYKSVRKALEMSNDEWAIISDSTNIYGLAKINETINKEVSIIDFTDYFEYSISINHIVERPWRNLENQIDETTHFQYLYKLNFKYGNLVLNQIKENKKNEINISHSISKEFEYLKDDEKYKLEHIIDAIANQKKGSMLVISNNAKEESMHLEYQSTLIKPRELNKELVEKISCIDGSVLIDEYGICYAIGVILDGPACKYGDKSRGARYNSAIKYIYDRTQNNNSTHKCIAIVKSEDGMINIIDRTVFTEEDEINDYNNEIIDHSVYTSDKYDDNYRSTVFEKYILDYIYEEYVKSMSEKNFIPIYIHTNLFYRALESYNNEINNDKNNVDFYASRADIYHRLANRYEHKYEEYINKALDDANKSLELKQKHVYAEYSNISIELIEDLLNSIKETKKAGSPLYYDETLFPLKEILNLDLEIEKDNKNAKLYYNRAKSIYILLNELAYKLLFKDNIIKLILEDLEIAKNSELNNTDILLDMANIYLYFAEKEYKEYKKDNTLSTHKKSEHLFLTTLECLDKAIILDENNINAYFLRSSIPHKLVLLDRSENINKRKKLFKNSIKDMEKVINLKNDNFKNLLPTLHKNVAIICEKLIKIEANHKKRNELIAKRNVHLNRLEMFEK